MCLARVVTIYLVLGLLASGEPLYDACCLSRKEQEGAGGSRREVLGAGLLATTSFAGCASAEQADMNTYEPMEALKDKPYGKPRNR